MATPYGSEDESDGYFDDEAGPSTRPHASLSAAKADPDVLAPIVNRTAASKQVHYFYSPTIGSFSYGYGHPMKPHRMRMAHSLINSYGLDQCMTVRRPKEADKTDMTRFHTDEYIDFLERVTPENGTAFTGQGSRFLIGEDCPPFPSVFQFCSLSSGGSISAAKSLSSGAAEVAINWAGGLHHAKKREASGFCYTNDIVLAILELLRTGKRVLYIDIDIHHGDGVEEAFYATDQVMTLSFHKFGDFFPGTGDVRDVGIGKGKGFAVNVPLRDGVGDDDYQRQLFEPVVDHIMSKYQPGFVVLQCGADSLAGDKLGCFNLSMRGHAACVSFLQSFGVPLLCLGGGGYTVRNVARTWAYETALLLGREPDEDLPYNDYMNWFGPEYKLDVRPTSMENLNSNAYLEGLRSKIIDNLRDLPCAPSVQMHATPKYSFNAHAEGELSDSEEEFELDKRVKRRLDQAYLQRQADTPMVNSDSEEDDADGCGHAAASASKNAATNAARAAIFGNGFLPDRTRSIFEREGSIASSIASTSKQWMGMGFTPSGLKASAGPPEALKKILAAKTRAAVQQRRRTTRLRRRDDLSDADMDSGSDNETLENDDDDDYDARMRSDDDDDGTPMSTLSDARGRSNGVNGSRSTKTGRPRRSFFDSTKPYSFTPPQSHALNGTHSASNGLSNGPNAATLDVAGHDPLTSLAMPAVLDVEEQERVMELERGRRGEGGGSELAEMGLEMDSSGNSNFKMD